jgi:malate dehydrogenase (oxaloacetate-decarboxylating)(NADP+)
VRPDALIATGRSDYPNQVNNVLCFPFIFRGALDVGATTINEEMKLAAVKAIAELAQAEAERHRRRRLRRPGAGFGPEYIIPQALRSAPDRQDRAGGGQAAMESGVATRPIEDFDAYRASSTTSSTTPASS